MRSYCTASQHSSPIQALPGRGTQEGSYGHGCHGDVEQGHHQGTQIRERQVNKEYRALITVARCQITYDNMEEKKKNFDVWMKQDGVSWHFDVVNAFGVPAFLALLGLSMFYELKN